MDCYSVQGSLLTLCDRTGIAAGSPVPTPLMKQLVEKMNLTDLTIAYGMSECCLQTRCPDYPELFDCQLRRVLCRSKQHRTIL